MAIKEQKTQSVWAVRFNKFVQFMYHWAAWIIIAVLAAAGVIHLLGGVDEVMRDIFAVVIVGLLVKELY